MVDVEQWSEIQLLHFVQQLAIKEICRRTGRSRITIHRALRSDAPPHYERAPVASQLDSHKEEIHRLLGDWAGASRG